MLNLLNDNKEETRLCSYTSHKITNGEIESTSPTDDESNTPRRLINLTDFEFKSINVDTTYGIYRWHMNEDESNFVGIRYQDVINFDRCASPRKGEKHHCVMCGLIGAEIPNQNKDVCKVCDISFWLYQKFQVVLKFCKGCKNFVTLCEFHDKPEASKCSRCRQRGRQNYFSKKKGLENSDEIDITNKELMNKKCNLTDNYTTGSQLKWKLLSNSSSINSPSITSTPICSINSKKKAKSTVQTKSIIKTSTCSSPFNFLSTTPSDKKLLSIPKAVSLNLNDNTNELISARSNITTTIEVEGNLITNNSPIVNNINSSIITSYNNKNWDSPSPSSYITENGIADINVRHTTRYISGGPVHYFPSTSYSNEQQQLSIDSLPSSIPLSSSSACSKAIHFKAPLSISHFEKKQSLNQFNNSNSNNNNNNELGNEWDPSENPLMHFAILTEQIFASNNKTTPIVPSRVLKPIVKPAVKNSFTNSTISSPIPSLIVHNIINKNDDNLKENICCNKNIKLLQKRIQNSPLVASSFTVKSIISTPCIDTDIENETDKESVASISPNDLSSPDQFFTIPNSILHKRDRIIDASLVISDIDRSNFNNNELKINREKKLKLNQ